MKNSPATGSLSIGFLFDDTLDSDAGVAQQVKTIGAWLSDQGHKVSYLVGQTQLKKWHGGHVYSLSRNLKVTFNGNKLSTPSPASRRSIRQALAEASPDVLHVQLPYSPILAGRVIKDADDRTAVVGTFHILPSGNLTDWGSRLLRLLYIRTIKRFGGIVSVSPAAADFAKDAYKINSLVLPNTINLSKFKVSKPTKSGKPRIVFLGRLVRRKGCAELLKAVANLLHNRSFTDFELIIAGDGPERASLERLTRRLGLAEHTKFLGYIDEADKAKLLASADVACFPALYGESFGIVLLEAMASGSRLILAGDNPGYRSVLGDRPDLLIDPRQTAAFSERLETFLKPAEDQDDLNRWLRQEVDRYDIDTVGPQILSLYREAIAKQRRNQ